jgi:hypothetical protein
VYTRIDSTDQKPKNNNCTGKTRFPVVDRRRQPLCRRRKRKRKEQKMKKEKKLDKVCPNKRTNHGV